jgi:fermentation-respiration switch protein FrsA (DUF1100 family)
MYVYIKTCDIWANLFPAGDSDEMIPPSMMERLQAAARAGGNDKVTLASVRKGMHNDTWTRPEYARVINDFLRKAVHPHRRNVQ